ncbi:methyl-accepting chemotaxis protein [Desulfoscipio geothermicus]|uniref:Methyl-accepting chemotaxis sensory transducer with Cache sensor n=1 Tax=Desulfoscipio geothermicus DSM 3669 TaxID=1121426 RepID=A0A1I6DRL0_9FIRM|nr:methyl-accepting chemotaxis protein [Desulfoscipio geothermicus]SFR08110.1 methyl-accepting chemotaxis sensory transducer with Cache sensor [Desulfoscipio geothermicus DSM 3669]
MNSLRLKLVIIISVATIALMGAVSYINYKTASNMLMDTLQGSAAGSAEYNAKIVNEWLKGIVKDINTISKTKSIRSMDPEEFLPVLKGIEKDNEDYEYLYVADKNGDGIGTNDKPVNVADRGYFGKVLQGQTVISDPIISKATGNRVIAVITPVYQDSDDKPDGLVGVTFTIKYLQELIKEMKINGYGYGFIQNKDMITIAHPEEEFVGNKKIVDVAGERLKSILQRMSNGEKGYDEYTFEGTQKLMAFAPVEISGWSVAQTANMADVMSPLGKIRETRMMVSVVSVVVMLLIALLIANFIAKPLLKLSQTAEAVAGGDLTQRVDIGLNSKDEIGRLVGAFAKMIENLKAMIADIRKNSEQLTSHSQELASASEEVSATVEEVASTTNEVAATSAQGAENAEEATRESEQMWQVAQEGSRAVRDTIAKINAIASASQNVSGAVQKLGEQSNQIGEIISTITNIADQTNLLALNAAIEAARAGEQGRGFAVVAEEVRKLAEQSAGAASEITDLIKEIQAGVDEAIAAMEHGTAEVNEGVQVAGSAGSALDQIVQAVEKNTALIQDVAAGSKQASEGTQQLTAAGEQIASTVQQVSGAAQKLANIAEELQNTVIKFKVDEV